jgi:DNA-binding response OmpR family regulator
MSTPRKNILIIDDDKKLDDLLKSYLTPFGMEVTAAYEPKEGLKLVKSLKPDLVIWT